MRRIHLSRSWAAWSLGCMGLLGLLGLLWWVLGVSPESESPVVPPTSPSESAVSEPSDGVRQIATVPPEAEDLDPDGSGSYPGESGLEFLVLVTDSKGLPLEGAEVNALDVETGESFQGISDGQGIAEIRLPGPRLVNVTAERSGYSSSEVRDVQAVEGQPPLRVALFQGVVLAITVLTSDGNPLSRADVIVSPLDFFSVEALGGFARSQLRRRTTDEDGRAVFSSLRVGAYHVFLDHAGYLMREVGKTIQAYKEGEKKEATVIADPGELVTVHVMDALTEDPIAGAKARIEPVPFNPLYVKPPRTTDDQGVLVFTRKPGDTFMVKILRHDGYLASGVEVSPDSNTFSLPMDRTPEKTVRLRLSDGTLVSEAILEEYAPGGRVARTPMVAENGVFVLGGLRVSQPPRIRFTHDSAKTRWLLIGPTAPHRELILYEPTIVRGRVRRAGSGEAVGGAVVTAWRVDGSSSGQASSSYSRVESRARTDADGLYELALPRDTTYRLQVTLAHGSAEDLIVDVREAAAPRNPFLGTDVIRIEPEGPASLPDILVADSGAVEVQVTLSGQPVPGAPVWLLPAGGTATRARRHFARTDALGKAAFRAVLPGPYRCIPGMPSALQLEPSPYQRPGSVESFEVLPGQTQTIILAR